MLNFKEYCEAMAGGRADVYKIRHDLPSSVAAPPPQMGQRSKPLEDTLDYSKLKASDIGKYENALTAIANSIVAPPSFAPKPTKMGEIRELEPADIAATHAKAAMAWLGNYARYRATSHLRYGTY